MKYDGKTVILFCVACIAFGFALGNLYDHWQAWDASEQMQELPTIKEIQELIGCEKIDGKLGRDWRNSETQTKWDLALNNQSGIRAMERFMGVEK